MMEIKFTKDYEFFRHDPPHNEGENVRTIVTIRDNKTGEERTYESYCIWDEDSQCPCTFIWEEGNYSCDCNRKIFFGQAMGEEYDDDETPCGDNAYSVKIVSKKNPSIVIYRDGYYELEATNERD
uniref:Uncharacterized protein n=1 Tax=viral metagenome TaxID=1070528 RepID=A0A6M3LKE5_9ZZZZ